MISKLDFNYLWIEWFRKVRFPVGIFRSIKVFPPSLLLPSFLWFSPSRYLSPLFIHTFRLAEVLRRKYHWNISQPCAEAQEILNGRASEVRLMREVFPNASASQSLGILLNYRFQFLSQTWDFTFLAGSWVNAPVLLVFGPHWKEARSQGTFCQMGRNYWLLS